MSNSPSKGTDHLASTGFSLDRSTPSLWRVTFDNPPINLIDPAMILPSGMTLEVALLAALTSGKSLSVFAFGGSF